MVAGIGGYGDVGHGSRCGQWRWTRTSPRSSVTTSGASYGDDDYGGELVSGGGFGHGKDGGYTRGKVTKKTGRQAKLTREAQEGPVTA